MKNQILKNSLTVISIAVCACLFLAETVKAQITFGEVKEAPKEIPDWERYGRKELCAPYDSTSLNVKPLPLIDAYKKYVGQQLFLLEVDSYHNIVRKNLLYSTKTLQQKVDYSEYNLDERERRERGEYTETDVYCPICKYNPGYSPECKNDVNKIINKYYNVIDVIDANDVKTEYEFSSIFNESRYLKYIDNEGKAQSEYVRMITPCFVLKETQSGDTVYTYSPDKFIIVGAFVKLQQEWIGKTYVECQWMVPVEYKDIPKNDIEDIVEMKLSKLDLTIDKISTWKCVNVTFFKTLLSFVFQNIDNPSIEKSITLDSYKTFDSYLTSFKELQEIQIRGGIAGMISEETKFRLSVTDFNQYANYRDSLLKVKFEEKLLAQQKEKEEKRLEEQQLIDRQKQNTAENAKRKQTLINKYGQTNGLRVYNQEPEIGMTKAMFDDMNLKHWIISTQKMETENGIAEVYVIRVGLYKCKRIVIINQRIKQVDNYNCN